MKLINNEYQLNIDLLENMINVLIIENNDIFSSLVYDLWTQCNGNEGSWMLVDNIKQLTLSKNLICIINPFQINLNEKRIITDLYHEIKLISDESLILDESKLNTEIIDFLDKVISLVPYSIAYKSEFDFVNLMKIYDLKIDDCYETLLEKIVEYIKLMNRVCHINIVVFVGIKQYLNSNEILYLYEFSMYEKVHLILIENHQYELLNFEKLSIIDKDLCIIST